MPKRSSKPPDVSALAEEAISPEIIQAPESDEQEKNAHAVALGRLGGKSGGKARAEKLSAERRSEIARQAANARWARKTSGD